jgi:ATP-dependent DNA helicase RecG
MCVRGTTRMIAELQQVGFPTPNFESESRRFRLIFYKQSIFEQLLKKEGLSQRQLLAVKYAREHGSISNAIYQSIAVVSRRTAVRELNELKLKGILISETERGRGVSYQLEMSNVPRFFAFPSQ